MQRRDVLRMDYSIPLPGAALGAHNMQATRFEHHLMVASGCHFDTAGSVPTTLTLRLGLSKDSCNVFQADQSVS